MSCGCGKKKGATTAPPAAGARAAAPPAATVIMYDVTDENDAFVASFSNPVLARAEARRTNGKTTPRRSTDPIPTSLVTANNPDSTAMVAAASTQNERL